MAEDEAFYRTRGYGIISRSRCQDPALELKVSEFAELPSALRTVLAPSRGFSTATPGPIVAGASCRPKEGMLRDKLGFMRTSSGVRAGLTLYPCEGFVYTASPTTILGGLV